jgi:hypothetical protein
MEARVSQWGGPPGPPAAPRTLLLLLALTVLLRLPFLNTPIQGDDHIYLTEAEHTLIDPLHPNNVKYIFMGDEVDLRGHSHPPGNAWPLAALLLLTGDAKEIPFHAAYIVFSLIAVWAVWSLARRFTEHPVWAVLLFIAVPAFVVNGNSLEADLPFLAFWTSSVALLCARRTLLCALTLIAATMVAYQALFLVPILAIYLWLFDRRNRAAWLLLLVPPVTFVAWQTFTRLTTGTMPAQQLAGYLSSYGFHTLERQLRGGLMLLIHSWFIVFPALVPFAAVAAWRRRHELGTHFLLAWIAVFFLCGLTIFFAGSARYLLPIAAPVAILTSRLPVKWLAPAFAAQLAFSLALAAANYEHWEGYRAFAASVPSPAPGHRIWVDNDWGLRYYMEARGALPARKDVPVRAGDIIVSSQLGSNVQFTVPLGPVSAAAIEPAIPLRLIALDSHSGYSTVDKGFLPFGISTGPADRVRAQMVMERHPKLEYLVTNSPEAPEQIVSGVYPNDRWMSGSAIVVLKEPAVPRKLRAELYVPDNAKARHVTLYLDGREVASRTLPGPGAHSIESAEPLRGSSVEIRVDQTIRAPGDKRDLGAVLLSVGFVQ